MQVRSPANVVVSQTIRCSSPGEFAERLESTAGALRVQPVGAAPFEVDLTVAALPRIAVFSVGSAYAYSVKRPSYGDYLCLIIPVRGSFSAVTPPMSRSRDFGEDEIYLWDQSRPLDLRVSGTSTILVALIRSIDLQRKVHDRTVEARRRLAEVIPRRSPAGGALSRLVQHLWTELQRESGLRDCSTAVVEMEDCVTSLLASAATGSEFEKPTTVSPRAMRRAEEYLLEHLRTPVTRSELARAAGVSTSTIARGFRERYGIGAMAWLRARRLEAAQRELRAAVPGEVTVTAVAVRCGFEHLGRFASDYRRMFGEPPSHTLRL